MVHGEDTYVPPPSSSSSSTSPSVFSSLLEDVCLLHGLGLRVVLVVGASMQIDRFIRERGGVPRFTGGGGGTKLGEEVWGVQRVTDDIALQAAKEAAGEMGVRIMAGVSRSLSVPLVRRHGGGGDGGTAGGSGVKLRAVAGNFVDAMRLGVVNGVDHLHTGRVRSVDTKGICAHLDGNNIVALTNIGYSPAGEVLNCRVYDVAVSTAIALAADKLLCYVSGINGVVDKQGKLRRWLTLPDATAMLPLMEEMRQGGVGRGKGGEGEAAGIGEGESNGWAKCSVADALGAALAVCREGIPRAHIINSRVPGSILLELYTLDGVGTMVSSDLYEGLRSASLKDVDVILGLLEPHIKSGVMAGRTRRMVIDQIKEYFVLERDGAIIACAALTMYEGAQAELSAFCVHPEYRNEGRGDNLLQFMEDKARQRGVENLFLLTTNTVDWFQLRGFQDCGCAADSLNLIPTAKAKEMNTARRSHLFTKQL